MSTRARAAYASIYTARSSLEARERVNELAQLKGRQADGFLLAVALNDGHLPFFYIDAREAAVLALGDRASFRQTDELTRLLQPHTTPALWQATAKALSKKECSIECTRRVLHFLERLLVEDPFEKHIRKLEESLPGSAETVSTPHLQEHATMKRNLIQVLANNRSSLFHVLVETYGLGTYSPAPIAVWVIEQAAMAEACPSLNEALRFSVLEEPKLEDIRRIAAKLQCEPPEPLGIQIR